MVNLLLNFLLRRNISSETSGKLKKCLPCLYYGLEACSLMQSQLSSLEFAVSTAFRKIFWIKSYDVVSDYVNYFVSSRISYIRERRTF